MPEKIEVKTIDNYTEKYCVFSEKNELDRIFFLKNLPDPNYLEVFTHEVSDLIQNDIDAGLSILMTVINDLKKENNKLKGIEEEHRDSFSDFIKMDFCEFYEDRSEFLIKKDTKYPYIDLSAYRSFICQLTDKYAIENIEKEIDNSEFTKSAICFLTNQANFEYWNNIRDMKCWEFKIARINELLATRKIELNHKRKMDYLLLLALRLEELTNITVFNNAIYSDSKLNINEKIIELEKKINFHNS